jgi:hypothetical protein
LDYYEEVNDGCLAGKGWFTVSMDEQGRELCLAGRSGNFIQLQKEALSCSTIFSAFNFISVPKVSAFPQNQTNDMK